MNKLLLSAAITAAIFAGQAQAALVVTAGVPNLADALTQTNKEVWLSGSSAATPFVEKSVAADCAGSIYKYSNSTTDFTWVCDSSIAAGTINIVHKRDGGGSVTGVKSALATITPSLAATYLPTYWVTSSLNSATCAAATTSNGVTVIPCTPTTPSAAQHNADIDLADVDGAQFESVANGNVPNASSLTGTGALATQIFGIVVNTRLYAAMQVASVAAGKIATTCITTSIVSGQNNASFNFPTDNSDACQPSLTTSQLTAILGSNRATDWYNLYFGGDALASIPQSLVAVQAAADQPTNTDIHYCSRTRGSGTLAAINIKVENQCFKGNEALLTAAAQTISAETDTVPGNQKIVHSMSGSGDLENCLVGLNDGVATSTFTPYPAMTNTSGPRWAIGIMGLDRNSTVAKKYRFIKIDGFAPTAENVVNGKYKLWAELVNLAGTSANPLAVDILANLGSANQITALNVTHPFGVSGFLGTATNINFLPTYDVAIAPGTKIQAAWDAARPVNPYTHATSTGASLNHCRAPSIPTGAKAIPAFN